MLGCRPVRHNLRIRRELLIGFQLGPDFIRPVSACSAHVGLMRDAALELIPGSGADLASGR